jgi:hypothetical protein
VIGTPLMRHRPDNDIDGLELIIIIFATLAQALSSSSRAISITGLIIFWRVLMVSSPRH